ncbi:MAG: hypothetical protein IKD58_00220 [Loktanella sp.]|nr:hypothetical protein [Loktanella sp.]
MSNKIMLDGVALCRPFAQGDLSNLCGLYAAVNAVCLVSAPIRPVRRPEAQQLLQAGLTYLERRNGLLDAFLEGMAIQRQRAVTQHVAKAASKALELSFFAKPLLSAKSTVTMEDVLKLIAKRIKAGSAIIVCLENTVWHYTVIVGMSDSRMYLFDSDGMRWIERRSLSLCLTRSTSRHCVSRASIIEVGMA